MTSTRRLHANRVNARASSGPRTAVGKAQSRRNSFWHGLSVSVLADPVLAAEAADLAQKIARNVNGELKQLAYRIAEAHIDLIRIRRVRNDLLARALRRHNDPSRPKLIPDRTLALDLARRFGSDKPFPRGLLRSIVKSLDEDLYGPTLTDCIATLTTLDRYERRALSRRKFAVRDFDAAYHETVEDAE
jgi:hypothetical protein